MVMPLSVMSVIRTSLSAQLRGEMVEASCTNLITLFLSVCTATHSLGMAMPFLLSTMMRAPAVR
eukprot:1529651-Prymnesium_polylepis.1